MPKNKKTTRGSDEAFWQLMKVSGNSLLKLLGFSAKEAEKYHFHAIELKDKTVKPDIEGFPILASDDGRIFIEFQGYEDAFIRHRLMAEIFLGCANESYKGSVMAGIVYTDEKYKTKAESLNTFVGKEKCLMTDCLYEIVLTDYTEKELDEIDPKLVILAPFTLPTKTDKPTVLAKGREWQTLVKQIFPAEKQWDALNILGLFILNRFRKVNAKEVMAMLGFDLMDSQAGKDIYDMGLQEGVINNAKEMLIDALEVRFENIPDNIIEQLNGIYDPNRLKDLFKQAMRCPDLEHFKKRLLS
jgi:predicted transposase YdaD